MSFSLSQRSKDRMAGVDDRLIEIAEMAIEITTVDFGIPGSGGKRTAEEQRKLYMDGKSKCDGVKKKSYHQTGRALDFFAYVDGKASWDEAHLTSVAVAFLQAAIRLGYQIEWGGLWTTFVDMPHVQLLEDD